MLELLVVITLLSLVMMMSVPAFTSLLQDSVDKELQRLSGVVRLLRNEAILKRRTMRLVFDLTEHSYFVEERTSFGQFVPREDPKILKSHKMAPLQIREVSVYGERHGRRDKTDKSASGKTRLLVPVVIDISGLVDPFQIYLVDGDRSWTLKVSGMTAKITLEEGYVEPRG